MATAFDLRPASAKAFARFVYARVPGAARFRFALKDLAAQFVSKPEFGGAVRLVSGQGQIVDVGANRGQSIASFRRLTPGCDVIAFEPEPRSAARLSEQFRSTQGITIHDCALGRAASRFSFFIPHYGRWDCNGMAATSRGRQRCGYAIAGACFASTNANSRSRNIRSIAGRSIPSPCPPF